MLALAVASQQQCVKYWTAHTYTQTHIHRHTHTQIQRDTPVNTPLACLKNWSTLRQTLFNTTTGVKTEILIYTMTNRQTDR